TRSQFGTHGAPHYTRRQRPTIPVRVGRLARRLSEGTTMKAVLASALAVGLCAIAFAQDKKADPVGTWKCEYEIGEQKRESTLTVKRDGDKLAGTMRWPDQKEA